jgi:hypothetical protein
MALFVNLYHAETAIHQIRDKIQQVSPQHFALLNSNVSESSAAPYQLPHHSASISQHISH